MGFRWWVDWLEECKKRLHRRMGSTRSWQTDISTSWGTVSLFQPCSSKWVLDLAIGRVREIQYHLNQELYFPCPTFTDSFTISNGGQDASSGLGLGRKRWQQLLGSIKTALLYGNPQRSLHVTETRGCDDTFSFQAHLLRMPQRDCSPLRDRRRCWEVWRGRAKQTKLTGAMDSKDSVSKLSPIKYLKRFKYLAKKNDGNVLDIFNVNNRNWKPRNLSREKWKHLFKCLVIAIVLNSYHTSFHRLAYFCPLKGPFKNF